MNWVVNVDGLVLKGAQDLYFNQEIYHEIRLKNQVQTPDVFIVCSPLTFIGLSDIKFQDPNFTQSFIYDSSYPSSSELDSYSCWESNSDIQENLSNDN
jgi:hypothetical protein